MRWIDNEQLDLANAMAWIPDSKTPNGVAEVPLTPLALEAFRDQMRLSPCSPYLFPSDENPSGHQRTLKSAWHATLRRAQVADDAYKQLPLGYHSHSNFCCGQFFWTHTLYAHENLELWRPVVDVDEPTRTIATDFRITPAGRDAFKRSLPLAVPKLETNEEFVVVRAKKRPVMLIQPEPADMAVNNRGYRGKVQRKRSLIAPIFGLADPKTGTPEFNPEWVDRIRKMEFPQLLFLPKKPGLLEVDSITRLDELQSVFTPHLDPTQFSLGDEMQKILKGQIQLFFANVGPNYYTELREVLLKS